MNEKIEFFDDKYVKELIEDFKRISDMKYIFFSNNYSAGVNLEILLNKSGGDFNIPDYGNVEIKTIEYEKKWKDFTLFSSRAEGPYVFPMQVIAKKYGYPDKDYKNINVIKGDVFGNRLNKIGLFYYFKLIVDRKSGRLNLAVYNYKKEFIGIEAFWYFDTLLEKLERKFKYLAVFYYKKIIKEGIKYYWFNSLELYYLNNKIDFFKLIEEGIVNITLTCGVAKSGYRKGQFIDHGVEFRISRKNIEKLFSKYVINN